MRSSHDVAQLSSFLPQQIGVARHSYGKSSLVGLESGCDHADERDVRIDFQSDRGLG